MSRSPVSVPIMKLLSGYPEGKSANWIEQELERMGYDSGTGSVKARISELKKMGHLISSKGYCEDCGHPCLKYRAAKNSNWKMLLKGGMS